MRDSFKIRLICDAQRNEGQIAGEQLVIVWSRGAQTAHDAIECPPTAGRVLTGVGGERFAGGVGGLIPRPLVDKEQRGDRPINSWHC